MADFFSTNGNRLKVESVGRYDAKLAAETDKAIRHLPFVVGYLNAMAEKLKKSTGSSNFEVITQNQPQTQRPRAYVAPKNHEGIHEELTQSVLLKAALGMAGQ